MPSVLLAGIALGCAGAPDASAPASSHREAVISHAERYLPLPHGHVFAYESRDEDTGERGVFTMEARRPREGRVDLIVAGRVTQRLEVRPDGICHLEGGCLLKAPLEAEAAFKGRFGKVVVHSTDRAITVPAGSFVGCIETVEEATAQNGSKKVTSVYCPDVGLVALDAEAITDEGLRHESVLLNSFGPRLQLETTP